MDKVISHDLFKHVQPKQSRIVDIVVSKVELGDLNRLNDIIKQVVTAHGCAACHSGLDIRFREEEELILHANQGQLTATTFGRAFNR
jgi:hypothetical protein